MLTLRSLSLFAVILMLNHSFVSANLMPFGWDKTKEGIFQIGFEGQYDDQSNNLSEGRFCSYRHYSQRPLAFSQFSPPLAADPDRDWGYVIDAAYIFPS